MDGEETRGRGKPRWRSGRIVGLLAIVILIVGIWYWLAHRTKATPPPAPLRVETMRVVPAAVPETIDTFGTIVSRQTVDVTPQADGVITSVRIVDGQRVHRGQILFTIDPRPLRAALAESQATLVRDAALARDAVDTVTRYAPLAAKGAVEAKSYVTAQNTVRSLAGTVALDRAQIRAARLSLAYTQVRSPIDGRAGAVQVKAGNVVAAASTTSLVVLNVVSRAEASFSLPLDQVELVRAAQAKGAGLSIVAIDPATQRTIDRGTLYFLDNAFDTSSGTLTLRARFANAGGRLEPGQFVPVRVILSDGSGSLSVPESALQQGQQGSYVYALVNGHAVVRQLAVARLVDGKAVVTKGLRAGDTVILTVPNELRNGDAVQSVNQPKTVAAR